MSEQIQSLLNQIENKFEQSFSESSHEEPINKQLNPESGKKPHEKVQDFAENNQNHMDFDQMKNLLLQELNQDTSLLAKQDSIGVKEKSLINQLSYDHEPYKNVNSKKLNTPNFKSKGQEYDESMSQMNKIYSQQCLNKNQSQKSEQNRENPFYYKQLTMKLQKALMKISSDKVVGPSKKLDGFYDRVEQFESKKQRQIERRKQQLQQKQINSIKDRPLINSHFRALVSQMSNEPIYVRAQKIIERRRQKQQQMKRMKQQKRIKQQQVVKQQYQSYMNELKQKYQQKGVRSAQEYYHDQLTWTRAREKNIESRMMQEDERMKERVTFKPMINSRSEKILMGKNGDKRVPIYERQPKQKVQIKDMNCTFKPKINKSTFYKKMTYYQI